MAPPKDPFIPRAIDDRASSAIGSFVITPDDDNDLPRWIRGVTIGTASGTIAYISAEGVACATGPLPVGSYDFNARRILATGTTATGLTGWV